MCEIRVIYLGQLFPTFLVSWTLWTIGSQSGVHGPPGGEIIRVWGSVK